MRSGPDSQVPRSAPRHVVEFCDRFNKFCYEIFVPFSQPCVKNYHTCISEIIWCFCIFFFSLLVRRVKNRTKCIFIFMDFEMCLKTNKKRNTESQTFLNCTLVHYISKRGSHCVMRVIRYLCALPREFLG